MGLILVFVLSLKCYHTGMKLLEELIMILVAPFIMLIDIFTGGKGSKKE